MSQTVFACLQFAKFTVILLGFALCANTLEKQAEKGKLSISGIVTSEEGKPLEEATIIAFNLDSGEATGVKTDREGKYEFRGLARGSYELSAACDGFDLQSSDEIKVSDKDSARYDVQLVRLFKAVHETE
jgi:hypothetical protein